MVKLKDLKLGSKIVGGFVIVLLLTAIVGYFGYSGLTNVLRYRGYADDGNRLLRYALDARTEETSSLAAMSSTKKHSMKL
ncbi:MAG: hypothetical protein U5K27_10370 [Desulfotignum sp.]|nr:hypothetical protein [Desulfotignum sp.]